MATHPADMPPALDSPVEFLPAIGPKRAAILAAAGVQTIADLLHYYPRTYSDRSQITPVNEVGEGDRVTVDVRVVKSRNIRLRGRLSIAEVTFEDGTGRIKATWFGQGYLARAFGEGKRAILSGEAGRYKGLALKNPEYEILGEGDDTIHVGRLVPIYRLAGKLGQRQLRTWIHGVLETFGAGLAEDLPESVREREHFPPIHEAIRQIHYPDSLERAEAARKRFAYQELYALQRVVLRQRRRRLTEEQGHTHTTDGPLLRALRESLPFELTAAQDRVIEAVLTDMADPHPMARLLQGDVGSGKTLVALLAAAASIDSGKQVAIMAPTELLAEQHANTAASHFGEQSVSIALVTGAGGTGRKATRRAVARGDAQLVVGTHALFQEATEFADLGLVIVDEQHRFGVMQRDRLVKKGSYPDILQMTATPIPRTIALTAHGAMDLSIIDELPPGRTPVETTFVPEADVEGVYEHIRAEAKQGAQTYLICPLVEESDKRTLRAVTTHYEELSEGPLAALRTELVHGRMAREEKDAAMRAFAKGAVDVLFSTSVIEVGIDVPNASTMVIEDASAFGLTQLHQLRGRVGRGARASRCFLLGEPKTDDGRRRIDVMCRTNDGFEIAEEDLRLRGPGEVRGLRQHGESEFRVADLLRDARLIEKARADARAVIEGD